MFIKSVPNASNHDVAEEWCPLSNHLKRLWRAYCDDLFHLLKNRKKDRCFESKNDFEERVDNLFDAIFVKDDVELKDYQICGIIESVSKLLKLVSILENDNIVSYVRSEESSQSEVSHSDTSSTYEKQNRLFDYASSGGSIFERISGDLTKFARTLFLDVERRVEHLKNPKIQCMAKHAQMLESKFFESLLSLTQNNFDFSKTRQYESILEHLKCNYTEILKQLYDCSCEYRVDVGRGLDDTLFNISQFENDVKDANRFYKNACGCFSSADSYAERMKESLSSFSTCVKKMARHCLSRSGTERANANGDGYRSFDFDVFSDFVFDNDYERKTYVPILEWYFGRNEILKLKKKEYTSLYSILTPICHACGVPFATSNAPNKRYMRSSALNHVEYNDDDRPVFCKKRKRDIYEADVCVLESARHFCDVVETVQRKSQKSCHDHFELALDALDHVSSSMLKIMRFARMLDMSNDRLMKNQNVFEKYENILKMLDRLLYFFDGASRDGVDLFNVNSMFKFNHVLNRIRQIMRELHREGSSSGLPFLEGDNGASNDVFGFDIGLSNVCLFLHLLIFTNAFLKFKNETNALYFRSEEDVEKLVRFKVKNVENYVSVLSVNASKIDRVLTYFFDRVLDELFNCATICTSFLKTMTDSFENRDAFLDAFYQKPSSDRAGRDFCASITQRLLVEQNLEKICERHYKKMKKTSILLKECFYEKASGSCENAIADDYRASLFDFKKPNDEEDIKTHYADLSDQRTSFEYDKRTIDDDDITGIREYKSSKREKIFEKEEKKTTVEYRAFDLLKDSPKKSNKSFLKLSKRWRVDMNFQMLVLRSYLFLKPIVTRGRIINEKKWTFDCEDRKNTIDAVSYMKKYGYFVVKSKDLSECRKKKDIEEMSVDFECGTDGENIEMHLKIKG